MKEVHEAKADDFFEFHMGCVSRQTDEEHRRDAKGFEGVSVEVKKPGVGSGTID